MILLFLFQPAVHRDGDHLPRNEFPALLERFFRRQFQPAAAGHLHAHDGDAPDIVLPDDLGQLFGIVVTESLLYPFLGGDSVGTPAPGRMLPSINLILPYYYPRHYVGTTDAAIRDLSRTALENTLSILHALEQAHQEQFSTALTLRRLGEALYRPRLPDRGRSLRYDLSLPASACLEDDLLRLDRIRMRGGMIHGA